MTDARDAARGPVIVSALFGPADFAWLNGLRQRHFPPERNQLDAHLTLFHHLPPDLLRELKQRLNAATRGQPRPDARIAGLMNLGGGVAFRVESPGLATIRDELAEAFAPLLVPQDRAGWRPHVTIQNKVPARAARALLDELAAGFTPRPLVISGLAAWEYRGGPWAPLSRHMFA
ncbi:2'-5' RNA ligase family protein [Sphingomonas sp. SFZ2018-12]|uniref:2'-5' RNA ligase family protein n=1 Tax=Sphingomonas sp. SFZ2018-12 TaxID=2683197 RepID=UPI001F0FC417|nr:2'-5' RNA ligase family protein [Sphingomonas sp. SFZ2018-12]MCH4892838.1 2'-5' RNA ligase family protein [Sphingomonas sp. SFZ2018-12]